jgi:hypothetical protein
MLRAIIERIRVAIATVLEFLTMHAMDRLDESLVLE